MKCLFRVPAPEILLLALISPLLSSAHTLPARLRFGELPLAFEPNRGQAAPEVSWLTRGPGYAVFFTRAEMVVMAGERVALRFAGARPALRWSGEAPLPGHSNYINGANPAAWKTSIPHYACVRAAAIYNGVDAVFYGNRRRLEFDFELAPGADPRAIRLRLGAPAPPRITPAGEVELGGGLRLQPPSLWQDGRPIVGKYVRRPSGEIGFEVGPYNCRRPLRIDPVLVYSTFLGGTAAVTGGSDELRGIAMDSSGSVFLAGTTESALLPASNGAPQAARKGGLDTFLMRLNPDGTVLEYCTYFGGEWDDTLYGLALDPAGNAYITGATTSRQFPVTEGALQKEFSGFTDAFLAKFSPEGKLVYSTLLGAESNIWPYAIAVDPEGRAVIAGQTDSAQLPVTPGAFQSARSMRPGFLAMFNPDGASLAFCTYVGGSYWDKFTAVAVDASGVYAAGQATSPDFPVTEGVFQTQMRGTDAVIAKLSLDGTQLLYSSFLGGSGATQINGLAVDAAGNVYAVGHTSAKNLKISEGALQPAYGGGALDAFIAKVSPPGDALAYLSYLGGSSRTSASAVALDPWGNILIVGETSSTDLAVTADAAQPSYGGGASDAFIVKLAAGSMERLYTSYLGGSGEDEAYAAAAGPAGEMLAAGRTASANFPVTPGAAQATLSPGGFDGFTAKWDGASALTYATYAGGAGFSFDEEALAVAVDSGGNAYVTGRTYSADFPVTPGSSQTAYGSGLQSDAFVTKIAPDGSTLVYSTYLGGSGEDRGNAIAVDADSRAVVVGMTASTDSPVTTGALQTKLGGQSSAFVVRLAADGSALDYSTYLGGTGTASAAAVAVDPAGMICVAGSTAGDSFPVTDGALQPANAGGVDAFVARLAADGSSLAFSTLIGGDGIDSASALAVDASGTLHVAGTTSSRGFPVTSGAFQSAYQGGRVDGFLLELTPEGRLASSTFLGGASDDEIHALAVDSNGNAYVTGLTASTNFPRTSGTEIKFQGCFAAKIVSGNRELSYSYYLPSCAGNAIAVDAAGRACFAGETSAAALPVTPDAHQFTLRGTSDAFLAWLNAEGKDLLFATYFGGSGADRATALSAGSASDVFLVGQTGSPGFRTTPGAFQRLLTGPRNAFVARFDLSQPTPPTMPVVSAVVNPWTNDPVIAPGSVIAIKGLRLAAESVERAKPDGQISGTLPTRLGNVTASIAGRAMPLFSVSPELILAQLPYGTSYAGGDVIVNSAGQDGKGFAVVPVTQAIGILAIYTLDRSPITAQNPVRSGETFLADVTGAGLTDVGVASGAPAPSSPAINARVMPLAVVEQPGNRNDLQVVSLTLLPGTVGLARAQIRLKAEMATDTPAWDLTLYGSAPSNRVKIYIIPSP